MAKIKEDVSLILKYSKVIDYYTEQTDKRISFNKLAIKYCLVCLRTYMVDIMNDASENENYGDAKACKDVIEEISKIIHETDK